MHCLCTCVRVICTTACFWSWLSLYLTFLFFLLFCVFQRAKAAAAPLSPQSAYGAIGKPVGGSSSSPLAASAWKQREEAERKQKEEVIRISYVIFLFTSNRWFCFVFVCDFFYFFFLVSYSFPVFFHTFPRNCVCSWLRVLFLSFLFRRFFLLLYLMILFFCYELFIHLHRLLVVSLLRAHLAWMTPALHAQQTPLHPRWQVAGGSAKMRSERLKKKLTASVWKRYKVPILAYNHTHTRAQLRSERLKKKPIASVRKRYKARILACNRTHTHTRGNCTAKG